MSEIKNGRLGVTLLNSDYGFLAEKDEMMVNKINGRLYYKNILGEVIDIFDRYASNVSEDRLAELEEAMGRLVQLVTDNGPAKMVHFKYALVATEDQQTVFKIPLNIFDKRTDLLILNINSSIPLEEAQYTINDNREIVLENGVKLGTRVMILIMKNVPHTTDDGFDGNIILDGTIGLDKFTEEVVTLIRSTALESGFLRIEHLSPEVIDYIKTLNSITDGSIEERHLSPGLIEKLNRVLEGGITEQNLAPELLEKIEAATVKEGAISSEHLSDDLKETINRAAANSGTTYMQEDEPTSGGALWLQPISVPTDGGGE